MEIQLESLPTFAREVLEQIEPKEKAYVIALSGELGAGKTTFMQALAKALDVKDVIQSPTFVLMRSYPISYKTFTKLVHIDAYRFDEPKQFKDLKPEEFLNDPHVLVCIEWPEKVVGELSEPNMVLKFEHRENNSREIEIKN